MINLNSTHGLTNTDLLNNTNVLFNKTENKNATSNANGEIDVSFQQGNIGDCALLSSVYAISLTDEGAEAIKNSIKIKKDENGNVSYDVHFVGTNETYNITQAELTEAKIYGDDDRRYSRGDDDMTILELAIEKCFTNSQDETLRSLVDNYTKLNKDDKLNGVNPSSVTYLLMGELSETVLKHNENLTSKFIPCSTYNLSDKSGNEIQFSEGEEYKATKFSSQGNIIYITGEDGKEIVVPLNEYKEMYAQDIEEAKAKSKDLLKDLSEDTNNDKSLVFATLKEETIKDVNGNDIKLVGPHAYCISSVQNGVITLINPHDTSKEIKIKQDDLLALDKYNIYSMDFSG